MEWGLHLQIPCKEQKGSLMLLFRADARLQIALEVLVEIRNLRLSTELDFSAKKSGIYYITPPILVLEAKFEYPCNSYEISDQMSYTKAHKKITYVCTNFQTNSQNKYWKNSLCTNLIPLHLPGSKIKLFKIFITFL